MGKVIEGAFRAINRKADSPLAETFETIEQYAKRCRHRESEKETRKILSPESVTKLQILKILNDLTTETEDVITSSALIAMKAGISQTLLLATANGCLDCITEMRERIAKL